MARDVIIGIAQKMHPTTLPERGLENLFDRTLQAFVAVRRHILLPVQTALFQARQKRRPAGSPSFSASSTARIWRCPSASMPTAI